MSDTGFTAAEKRWDPPYSRTDFVPQSKDALDRLVARCDGLDESAQAAHRGLTSIAVPGWKGAAAQVFTSYVGELAGYARSLRDVARETREQLVVAGRALQSAIDAADRAVGDLNDAQRRRKDLEADDGGGLGGLLDKIGDLPGTVTTAHDLDVAYGHATGATRAATAALDALVTGLDHADATVSALRAPEPPSAFWEIVFDHVPPDQIPLLQALFGPVGDALEREGATAAAEQRLAEARAALDGSDDDRKKYLDGLGDLGPQELAYVLDHLDEDDVAALLGSLDPDRDRAIYNRIAAVAPADLLRRLGDTDPNHYWHPYTGQGGRFAWGVPTGMRPGEVPTGDPTTLQQGMLGDCHVLASLAAAEQANPGFLRDHVRANANGTYTVTLYKDGHPIEVVVTAEFPFTVNPDGTPGSGAYAHGGASDDTAWTSDVTLYMIYEKALAQTWHETNPDGESQHGYDGMNGGWPYDDMPVITGHGMDNHQPPGDVSLEQVQQSLADHKPVTVTTLFEPDAGKDPLYDADGDNQAIPGHEYYIVDIEGTPPDATVVLGNPWGTDLPGTGTLRLTWEQVQSSMHSVQVGR